ncbi:Transposon Tf2-12 polyprotein [Vitis vinifera]|uniref:Transposon Tf2-12 polyprotein n=1 Tax=Vitis vinifera TaxID=29760 RepID=A0A438D759_VITVI|nr:Transposon Tf2-12 polyprotein [Vitis vinifera]
MQDNESLREFVKRFGQAVLQVEACSMDAVLPIFKRSICPGTSFFESLAKKPHTTMDELFRRANKYSMVEDDVRAATQQVLVAGQASRGGTKINAKLPDRPRLSDRRQEGPSLPERPPLTPLSISYEKLLPMIQGLSDFKWPRPIGTDPSTRDHNKRCAFHKDHGHTTETCRCLHFLVEKLIKAGHLKQYLRSDAGGRDVPQNPNSGAPRAPATTKAVINYINGGPSDEEYDSRRKRQRLLRAASVRERINSIQPRLTRGGPRPIDGTIIFPLVDPTRTLQPHRDALILSLEIGNFDVRHILVDPGSSVDLVQASVVSHMGHSLAGLENPRTNPVRIQRVINYVFGRHCTAGPSRPSHSQRTILGGTRVITLQYHLRAHMATLHESYPLYISSNGHTVEVYIDDIVVKSKTREEHVLHLQEVFHLLRKYGMKLNPSKCAFGVSASKFLGFMVSQRGIEVSPDQVKAVIETPPPRNKKELQRLTGKLVALGRFIARFTEELRPFFLAIRKTGTNGWTDNCQNAFERIKHCFMQPPILSNPIPKEKLYMYLVVSEWAVSAVLFRSPSPKEQRPIYYVSRALADVETWYSKMELTTLALRSAAQKLRPYFQAHPMVVLTDQPLSNILHKPDLTGRMLQWAIELREFGIEFQPRLSMKGQVMADFVLEYSRRPRQSQK